MNKTSTKKSTKNTRKNAADPFPIYFKGESYQLTEEQLLEQADSEMDGKHMWQYPQVDIISFEAGVLNYRVQQDPLGEYQVTIKVEEENLLVSCNCGGQVERICVHALKLMQKLIRFTSDTYFEKYRPGSLVATAIKYPSLFEVLIQVKGCDVKPKMDLGVTYQLTDAINPELFSRLLDFAGAPNSVAPFRSKPPIAYVLLSTKNKMRRIPPFLFACEGIENKAGTTLKGFGNFIQKKENFPSVAGVDMTLSDITLRFREVLNDGNIFDNWIDRYGSKTAIELFELWETAVLYLEHQKYIYWHPLYRIRYLNRKPFRTQMQPIRIKSERPVLSFRLSDYGDYCQLELIGGLKNKALPTGPDGIEFFLNEGEDYYLVASPRDAAMLQWMREMGGRITILKEHFDEFDAVYLSVLREYYPVAVEKPSR